MEPFQALGADKGVRVLAGRQGEDARNQLLIDLVLGVGRQQEKAVPRSERNPCELRRGRSSGITSSGSG